MPFMDWRLVTYVMALPDGAKSDSQQSKLVAREAMAGLMPDGIRVNKLKIGFNSPMPGWMNGPLKPWVDQLLSVDSPAFSAIVDLAALRRRVEQLSASKSWDWQTVGRLWPYLHLKWYIDEVVKPGDRATDQSA